MNDAQRAQPAPPEPSLPTEPFPCPACGQMLAPSCRVCVACQTPVDLSKIPVLAPAHSVVSSPGYAPAPRVSEPVRFPWRIFLIVLLAWLAGGTLIQQFFSPGKSQLLLAGVQILTSIWVFYDAEQKRVPRPLRWGLGSLLLWPLIFPWYLARRKQPEAPCPFVEAPVGPIVRAVLFVLLIVFLFLILKGPPTK